MRTAGEGQAEEPRDLVEGLAGSVVDRRPERAHVVGHVGHQQQGGVAARHEQRDRRFRQRTVFERVHRDVGGEVVDAEQGAPEPVGQGLRGRDAHQQGACQARSTGDSDGIDVRKSHTCLLAGALDGRNHRLEVGPAGDLGYHAAEPGVLVHAARDRVEEQLLSPDEPDAGLVAGGLDAQHQRGVSQCHPSTLGAPCRAFPGWAAVSARRELLVPGRTWQRRPARG